MSGAHQKAEHVLHQARLVFVVRQLLLAKLFQPIDLGFFGKLRFDFAHTGQAQHFADARGIDSVLRGQDDGDQNDCGGYCRDNGRFDQLP
jgi:hypothetical protein